jgi:hypothetical protein
MRAVDVVARMLNVLLAVPYTASVYTGCAGSLLVASMFSTFCDWRSTNDVHMELVLEGSVVGSCEL